MAAHKSLLLRLELRPAGRRCVCKHNSKHVILKGDVRFVVQEPGAATREFGYCADCARAMLEQAVDKLSRLRRELG